MNTLLDIVLWGIDRELAEMVSDRIFGQIKQLQKVLDRFNPDAETFQINQTAHSNELVVSPVLLKEIKRGIEDFHRSQGYFNVFAGGAYASLKETDRPPAGRVTEFMPEEMIAINESQNKIRFLHNGVSLDFGGIGKGLALDEASKTLDEMKIKNAFISFGGSSILTRGHHPHGDYWPFSFQDNKIEEAVWALNNDAVSVSGSGVGSGNHPHILDPRSGRPSENITAGVQSDSAAEAEILSTALVAAPPAKHQEIVSHFNIKKWAVFDIH
ncbi:FAD:protein FMN transferase [Marinilabilia rubra]|nr:FAD:protein FMN transferase [Marinilabilia rubra]